MAAATWPTVTGTDIGGSLASLYEPSGLAIYNGKLYVVTDEGEITRMTTTGSVEYQTGTQLTTLRSRSVGLGLGADLEAITTGNDQYLYLGYEGTNMMAQFDPSSMTLTGKIWSFNSVLSPIIGTDTANGMEALTITPNYVITGIQHNGQLYYFSVNFLAGGSTPTYLGPTVGPVNMASLTGDTTLASDISDLYYSTDTQKVYAIYDSANKIVEFNEAGTSYSSKLSLPTGNDQEGLSVISNCSTSSNATVYIAEDTNGVDHQVWEYASAYPVTCPVVVPTVIDADGDGVSSTLDCNDSDPKVSANQTYYRDADGDGLGDLNTPTSVCSATPPAGYVTNNTDLNDSDFDNDGVSTNSDCNDADATVWNVSVYYQDLDGDGMGSSISISMCSLTAPTGYVTNSNETSDANDLISNAGIEIYGDGKDNDNDGKVDEYNSVTENGYHPYFANLDPNDVSLAATSLVSWSGLSNGYIKVKYADNSIYKYKIFSTNSLRLTKVKQLNSSAYFKLTAPNGQWVKVNGYTGVTTATGLMAK